MKEKRLCSILVLLLLALAFDCVASATALVTRVIDGDTIEVNIDGTITIYEVRYINLGAPELGDELPEYCAWAPEATKHNRQLVAAKTVRLEKDVSEISEYGRLLRYVYVDDIFVNAYIVKNGLTCAKVYEQDTEYQNYFQELET